MKEYINFLRAYLNSCFLAEAEFLGTHFNVCEAYDYNNDLSCPQIAIQTLDDAEAEQYTSFEAENVTRVGVQINVFAENMKIDGTTYTAKDACEKIADIIKTYMNKLRFEAVNSNIVRLVRVGKDYTMPLSKSGQVYVSVLRYDSLVVCPYLRELENLKEI